MILLHFLFLKAEQIKNVLFKIYHTYNIINMY